MYIPNQQGDVEEMLRTMGMTSVSQLFADIPPSVRLNRDLAVPGPLPEWELLKRFHHLAGRNLAVGCTVSFLGAGCYEHHIPSALKHLVGRSEFYTAYTPYQPELSQGTLQAIFEFQTYVARLTGMDAANASMYDGATALAEAVLMAQRVRPGREQLVVSGTVHPEYRQVARTLTAPLDLDWDEVPATAALGTDWQALTARLGPGTSCVVVQNPNCLGSIEDLSGLREAARRAREVGALFIVVVVEPLSLGLLRPPGGYGADVVVGEGQSLGIPMAFGGPHLGLLATRSELVRQMPGRLVGETRDRQGRRGFVLTLATREQHIRRERATSNICTNQSLCALTAAVYLALLGPSGLRGVAAMNLRRSREAISGLASIPGFEILQDQCFNEFTVRPPIHPGLLNELWVEKGILGGWDLGRWDRRWEGLWLMCCTETRSAQDIQRLVEAAREATHGG